MKMLKIKLITLIVIILLATPVSARPMTVKVNRCRQDIERRFTGDTKKSPRTDLSESQK